MIERARAESASHTRARTQDDVAFKAKQKAEAQARKDMAARMKK